MFNVCTNLNTSEVIREEIRNYSIRVTVLQFDLRFDAKLWYFLTHATTDMSQLVPQSIDS